MHGRFAKLEDESIGEESPFHQDLRRLEESSQTCYKGFLMTTTGEDGFRDPNSN
jgi:hypothetical protein